MAISITQSPNQVQRAGGKHIYVATSTNVASTGFKFIVTIDVGGDEVYKGYHDANPSGRLMFDARKVLEAVVKADVRTHTGAIIHKPTTLFARYTDGIKQYTINFGEVFVVDGVLTEHNDLATSTRVVTQGWYDGREEMTTAGYSKHPYISNTQSPQARYPFLTSMVWNYISGTSAIYYQQAVNIVNPEPSILTGDQGETITVIDVTTADDGVLVMTNIPPNTVGAVTFPATHVRFIYYNGDNVLATYDYELTTDNGTRTPTATEVDGRYVIIGAYPNNILGGLGIILNPSWTSYTVQPYNTAQNLPAGQYVRFRKTTRPCKADMRRIAWVNRFGGYDYFWFEGATQFTLDGERKTYRKLRGDYGGTSLTVSRYDSERENYYNDVKRGYNIKHGGVTHQERTMLESLFTSKVVWIYEDDNWIPVNITNSSYARMGQMSKHFVVEFTVNLGYDANA
jgi:hypothetical protein